MFLTGSPFVIRVGTKKRNSTLPKTTVKDVLSKPVISESPTFVNHMRAVSPILDNSSPLYSPQFVKQTQYLTKNLKNNSNIRDNSDFVSVNTVQVSKEPNPPIKVNLTNGEPSRKGILKTEKFIANDVLSSDSFKKELMQRIKSPKSPSFTTNSTVLSSTPIENQTLKSSSSYNKFERIQSPIDRSLSPLNKVTITSKVYKSTERSSSPIIKNSSPVIFNNQRDFNDMEENTDKFSNIKSKFFSLLLFKENLKQCFTDR